MVLGVLFRCAAFFSPYNFYGPGGYDPCMVGYIERNESIKRKEVSESFIISFFYGQAHCDSFFCLQQLIDSRFFF